MGGQNSQDSTLERRSLIWNDNNVETPDAPPAFSQAGEYEGKFFTRGCRGKIEEIQMYCRSTGLLPTIVLRFSAHPCIGPFYDVTITPGAPWDWVGAVFEEMWNYDSLFIWVHSVTNADWAYDAALPYDGHLSLDAGATWADMGIRPFIRAVYTGETPGDVPVSGIINNIPIPSTSAHHVMENLAILQNVNTTIVLVEGAGYVDLVVCRVAAGASSDQTNFIFYADDVQCFFWDTFDLDAWGFDAYTQPLSVTKFLADGECIIMITKRWEFRRTFRVTAINTVAGQFVYARVYPNLMR